MAELRATGLVKRFPNGVRALDDVSFVARSGRVLTLLGPSGCGKSTLLRVVAGLEEPTSGRLLLDGQPLEGVPAGRRGVGFVFQDYALYPHLSVARNLSLALETQRLPEHEVGARVRDTAASLGITELLDRRPSQLSGGQQQRVALGRALARRPRLFLLDEPLSNLDALLREAMRAELKSRFAGADSIVLYVTHDQTEAMSLSDDLVVMREGRVLQAGPPLEVYRHPADTFVATFVGTPRMSLWHGRREGAELVCRGVRVPLPGALQTRDELVVGMRPEDAEVSVRPLEGGWPARRVVVEPLGSRSLVTVEIGGERARVLAEPSDWPESLWLRWPPGRRHWFDGATGARIPEREPTHGGD